MTVTRWGVAVGTDNEDEYLFDSTTDLGARHLSLLRHLFDPMSIDILHAAGVNAGARCLDLGTGAGSIARWMAERSSDGTVIALDKDTEQISDDTGIEVLRHDITQGLPVDGPFDVIHARLFLMHFPNRAEIVSQLVERLAPGGWLVVGDFHGSELPVLSVPSPGDAEFFRRMVALGHDVVSDAFGVSWDWAGEAPRHLMDAGLENVRATESRSTMTGGDPRSALALCLNRQVQPLMERAGATADEIARFHRLLVDPGMSAWFYRIAYTRGQRPTE
ncbi:methyltransferase domain-containing protein [Spiractinospora alimapuensis]|uniref:class I SAM-dependent methyltransferase n=1 Tax=Spiractinospora alimapuensis TaxID=2820884 RepID=UPI001F2CF632|nr:class I SAM-dependent methyltransferase [Spiractinospora alimapuensis]QVQ50748.1 methyltransferase domain-containing protein [Spiractinospora alimapuensis]